MSHGDKIDKDRLYFTQNNKPIRLRCPECIRTTKSPRHCKIFKNPAALWWHLRQDHGKFVYSQFSSDDICEVLNNLTKAIRWGIVLN